MRLPPTWDHLKCRHDNYFASKDRQGDVIVEMVIWALPQTTAERPHGLKYRLYCGRPGRCLIRYDYDEVVIHALIRKAA